MANTQLKFLLMCFCIMGPQAAKGDQCPEQLTNLAVLEGASNTLIKVSGGAKDGKWEVVSTSNENKLYPIGGLKGSILLGRYDITETGLVIKNATTNGNPISTAGVYSYITQCNNTQKTTQAKLLVVRKGLQKCPSTPINSTSSYGSCSITYADYTNRPIQPIATWTIDGVEVESSTLQRTKIDQNLFYAESTITANRNYMYQCHMTFAAPTDIPKCVVFATNAPKFRQSCTLII